MALLVVKAFLIQTAYPFSGQKWIILTVFNDLHLLYKCDVTKHHIGFGSGNSVHSKDMAEG